MNIDSPLDSQKELLYLQNLLNQSATWFNKYIEATESGLRGAEDAHDKYLIAKSLGKFYHLGVVTRSLLHNITSSAKTKGTIGKQL